MRQIVYISQSHERLSDAQLSQILEVARRNNRALGVTGMLLYAGNTFFQVLEGPRPAVEQIYDTVFMDERHARVRILSVRDVDQREFKDWSMGFRRLQDDEIAREEFFELTRTTLPDNLPGDLSEKTITFLRSFSQTKIAAA